MFWEHALYITAWLSFGCWAMAALLRLAACRPAKRGWLFFLAIGNLMLWFHILVAYSWRHQWSWQHAVIHTRQILDQRQLAWVSAEWSVVMNWMFAISWSLLLAISTLFYRKKFEWNPKLKSQSILCSSMAERMAWGVAGFFWFQAAVVFAKSGIRALAGIILMGLLLAALVRFCQRKKILPSELT